LIKGEVFTPSRRIEIVVVFLDTVRDLFGLAAIT
jgi:hypothetical protein